MNGTLGRIIFPSFVLAMWVTFGVWLAQGDWTGLNWLMLGTAAVLTGIVFVDFVSVFSYGYAFCMIALPAEVIAVRGLSTASLLVGGLSILYGIRLIGFMQQRRSSASYAPARAGEKAANANVPTALKLTIFVLVTWLQLFEAMSPYVVGTDGRATTWVWVGAGVMLVGLFVETVADQQKQRAKDADPTTFVRGGLYAKVRHPNYTGEIVFQVGLAAAAFGSVDGWWQWLAVVLAPAYICVLMWFQARSGDARMATSYAGDPEFATYAASTGSLLPGIGKVRAPAQ